MVCAPLSSSALAPSRAASTSASSSLRIGVLCLLLARAASTAAEAGFLNTVPDSTLGRFGAQVSAAISSSNLGGGEKHHEAIMQMLRPTFSAVPKNKFGLLDRPALEHMVHSYFLQEHGWLVHGLDMHKNSTGDTSVNEESSHVLDFVQSIVKAGSGRGFDLSTVARTVAGLEHLIVNEGVEKLLQSYAINGFVAEEPLPPHQLSKVFGSYMLFFVMGAKINPSNKTLHDLAKKNLPKLWPEWAERSIFTHDLAGNFAFETARKVNPFKARLYTFEELSVIMEAIITGYGKFQEFECTMLKEGLMDLDSDGFGRIPLGRFYRKQKIGVWKLSESPDFLRTIGALDETGRTSQVILSNYMNTVSNCDKTSQYYAMCCIQECEGLLDSLEVHFQSATASVADILAAVSNLPSSTVNVPRNLSSQLVTALQEVGEVHGGEVPLHGRLFAQWLHYAFPHECPYPHLEGTISQMTTSQYREANSGRNYTASDEELLHHLKELAHHGSQLGESSHMSQWTLQEELRMGLPSGGRGDVAARVRAFLTHVVQASLCLVMLATALRALPSVVKKHFPSAAFTSSKKVHHYMV